MKIVSIVGARPQFIKLAPISRQLRKYYNEIILHTGQHYDDEMSNTFFKDLEIPIPDYNLHIGSDTHGAQTGKMLAAIESKLLDIKPNLVLVFGDTNSTIAGALASEKLHIPVGHIEAGLRSYNRQMPEEINRLATDHISDLLFAPTQTAMDNLNREDLGDISYLTGDIMVDTLEENLEYALENSTIIQELEITENNYYLLTLHRPYNVDNPDILDNIIAALADIDLPVVFPVHPRTKKVLTENKIKINSNFILIQPMGYLDFINLEANAQKIITDSGGIQKESYILKKPCITLRTETEWVETVEDGWNILVQPQDGEILQKIIDFTPSHVQTNVFGQNVAKKMADLVSGIFVPN